MAQDINFTLASSSDIEAALCQRLEKIRIAKNINQTQLADDAGVSRRTITRMENGQGVSFDTFIRVVRALGLAGHLASLLPDPQIRPIDRVRQRAKERKYARPKKRSKASEWAWGEESNTQ